MISSSSSADYYVNEGTTHKAITDWIDTKAKNGDNLIFNTSKYELTDRLNFTKSINIKSYKNTSVNFNKAETMFSCYASGKVVFSDLTLNHKINMSDMIVYTIFGSADIINIVMNTNFDLGSSIRLVEGNIVNCTINSKSHGIETFYSKINISNTRINTEKDGIRNDKYETEEYDMRDTYWHGDMINSIITSGKDGLNLNKWKGNVVNCTIISKSKGIEIAEWKGNILNSTINTAKEGISDKVWNEYVRTYWYGDMVNTTIISWKNGVKIKEWNGKIINSTIYVNGLKSNGIDVKYSQGIIKKSKIISKNSYATKLSDDVKILNSSISSKKGLLKTYRYLADLKIREVILDKGTYYIFIINTGYSISKPTQIGLKAGKLLKKTCVKSIKPHIPESKEIYDTYVKITLPKKYLSKKYLKTLKVDYYKKNRELNKKNNIIKFRLEYIY